MASSSKSLRNFISIKNKYDRVVLLVDMDCFYCQVEEKLDSSLKGQPVAVVQYNTWRGGGIIAVNYAARIMGVTRHMRGDEAQEHCPDIKLVKVPNVREKADLTKYREAGKEVANVLQRFTKLMERASVDEAYLDITEAVNERLSNMNSGSFVLQPTELINTFAVGYDSVGNFVTAISTNYLMPKLKSDELYCIYDESDELSVRQSNIRLLIGASLASEIRAAVKLETGYECSAGIAHNKILAKLACGINKPNKQTILPLEHIPRLFETLPVSKIKGLGAKFGEEICKRLNVRYLGDLLKFTESELQSKFDEKNGSWLYLICRGIDLEVVTPRFYSKSIGCCKKFPGRNAITGYKTLRHWLKELSTEISDRLKKDIEENNRRAKQMVVNFVQEFNADEISSSRAVFLVNYDPEIIAQTSLDLIKANTKQFFRAGDENVLNNPIKFLGISVGKFETILSHQNKIKDMFVQQAAKKKNCASPISCDKETVNKSTYNTNDAVNGHNGEDYDTSKTKNILNKKTLLNNPANINLSSKDCSFPELIDSVNVSSFGNNLGLNNMKIKAPSSVRTYFGNTIFSNECFVNRKSYSHSAPKTVRPKTVFVREETQIESSFLMHHPEKVVNANSVEKNTQVAKITETDLNTDQIKCCTPQPAPFNMPVQKAVGFFVNALTKKSEQIPHLVNAMENNSLDEDTLINSIKKNEATSSEGRSNRVGAECLGKLSSTGTKRKSKVLKQETIDYRLEYYEYNTPDLKLDFIEYTICDKCSAYIPNDAKAVQSHYDHHFAEELSHQQTQDFNQELCSKKTAAKSCKQNTKKNKKSLARTGSVEQRSISQFIINFEKSSISEKAPQLPEKNTELCNLCKMWIAVDKLAEHKDFHFAKELQRNINRPEVNTVHVAAKTSSGASCKRFKSVDRSTKFTTELKPISQFFFQSKN